MTESEILKALSSVQDPDLHRDIVSLGFVKNVDIDGGKVSVTIELTTPACPVKDKLKNEAADAVSALPGVEKVDITMTAQVRASNNAMKENLLPGVKNIIPVASGKGGVGKSTVSANLALALSKKGAKVGLLDADIYGPSIPQIVGTKGMPRQMGNIIHPVQKHNLKVISMAYFLQGDQAVIWRGPMLAKMLEQFIGGVEWGELDYLIIDLPPGTGDIQLTLCQSLPLTGAVIVTTPQDVAFNVARKAILMFQKMNIPVLGLIENMSHYKCTNCGHEEHIFGQGGADRAKKEFNIPLLGEIPLTTSIRIASDKGEPVIINNPDGADSGAFIKAAENLAAQVSIRNIAEVEEEVKVTF